MTSAVAAAGVFLLATLAPFEMTTPIVRLPGQSLTNLEAILLCAIAAWGAALLWSRCRPRIPHAARPWFALIAAMSIASAMAPAASTNAWHMTGRFTAAAAVFLLAVDGITTPARLRTALSLCVAAGVVVAVAAMLEYAEIGWALRMLRSFRPSINVVGAQVRAGGTLQYPTIASMYLEVVFALGLGVMLQAVDLSSRVRAALWFVALLAIGEAIALTFSRAGLITMGTSLALAGATRLNHRGVDAGVVSVGAVAVGVLTLLVATRSTQSLWLRVTTEGQNAWYRADVGAPSALAMSTDRMQYVSLSVTNTGRAVWDSTADPPIFLSYHWLQSDDDRVVAFEGERTAFERPVAPGETASVHALVRAPQYPGSYRLEWDLAQEGRLWFSTEQDAPASTLSSVTVTGVAAGAPPRPSEHPRRALRPGRLVLWQAAAKMIAAHPFLGSGPDNFRLLYGRYAGLTGADSRTHSNNMYLEILVGGGLVAAAAFVWLLHDLSRIVGALVKGGGAMQVGIAAAGIAVALHGLVDSFLSFAPTYILFALTLGLAAAAAGGLEITADAHRV